MLTIRFSKPLEIISYMRMGLIAVAASAVVSDMEIKGFSDAHINVFVLRQFSWCELILQRCRGNWSLGGDYQS